MLFIIFLIFESFFCATIQGSIKNLHKKTPFRTFYELFDETENATFSNIRKKYRKYLSNTEIIKNNILKYNDKKYNTSKEELIKIITDGYNVLTKHKEKYDEMLKTQFTIPFDPETKIFFIINLIIATFFLIFVFDVIISFLIYLKNKKKIESLEKKERKKMGNNFDKFSLENLFMMKILRSFYGILCSTKI